MGAAAEEALGGKLCGGDLVERLLLRFAGEVGFGQQ
jgi:hypothetical protein